MIRPATVPMLALVLLAAPARAEEPDADTRFHDAYVLEVIEGEIAEAAKAYLTLVGDEQVSTRIRDEARFRFAICTVLLGRPDEGRMQLAAIVKNERTPASLRERAEAYLESISALGVGTELDRKLQSLVFDLGRSDIGAYEVAAYRDFEIIGEPAIPFLERLLQHADVRLRRHAFRLLIRLGAENLIAKWTPEIAFHGGAGFQADLVNRYLARRPDEVRRLETRLLALPDERLGGLLQLLTFRVPWSLAFVKALVPRGVDLMDRAFGQYLARAGTGPQQWAFVRECILGEDVRIREAACSWALQQQAGPPDDMAVELWLPVVRRAAALGGQWLPNDGPGTLSANMQAWAQRMPTDRLLHALAGLAAIAEVTPIDTPTPLHEHGVAGLVVRPLAERALDAKQLGRYEALVRRWIEAVAPQLDPASAGRNPGRAVAPLRDLLVRLPADRAAALVRWLFAGPAHERAAWFDGAVEVKRPEDVSLLLEAVRAAAADQQERLLRRLPQFSSSWPSAELARAEILALPDFLRLTSVAALSGSPGRSGVLPSISNLVGRVPDEDLAQAVDVLFETAAALEEGAPRALSDALVSFQAQTADGLRQRTAFFVRCVLPAIEAHAERLPASLRRHVIDRALFTLRSRYPFAEGDRERLAAIVLRNLDAVQPMYVPVLTSHLDLFPLERWLPDVAWPSPAFRMLDLQIEGGRVDAPLRVLTADVEAAPPIVVQVVVGFATPELAHEVADRMLASPEATTRHRILAALRPNGGYPATEDGLEKALSLTLAEAAPDLSDLAKIALLLSERQPSERLLPAAERLLASAEKKDVLLGIQLAGRLGRESLIPALARLLDSMDAGLRDRAKAAILDIQELKRMQEEAGGAR